MSSLEASTPPIWEILCDLFPVVVQIDSSGNVVRNSALFGERCALELNEASNFFELFTVKRPVGFSGGFFAAQQCTHRLFLAFSAEYQFAIRGQLIDYSSQGLSGLCFVGMPWLDWIEENVGEHDLSVSDFPVFDIQAEQLFLQNAQKQMTDGVQSMNAELKRAQEAVNRADRMRQGYFNYLSHEMRTPLNGVISALTLLDQGQFDEQSNELLGLATQSANRLLDVINLTLETASLESHSEIAKETIFDLDVLLNDCLNIVKPRAMEKGLTLGLMGGQFEHAFRGRSRLLQQVLTNLLGNAVKFSNAGEVLLACLQTTVDGDEVQIRFSVSDEGPGIPADAREKIFEPFATGVSEATRDQQGTGLGLSIVERFVRLLGGTIDVQSELHAGATFEFLIPLRRLDRALLSAADQTPSATDSPPLQGQVLLVDDEQTNLLLNTHVLEAIGLSVTPVNSAAMALEALRTRLQHFDLVLMDLEMPEMNGDEAVPHIRRIPGLESLPVIALSAHVGEVGKRRSAQAGMAAFLSKPLVKTDVVQQLSIWLGQGRSLLPDNAAATSTEGQSVLAPSFDGSKLAQLREDLGASVAAEIARGFVAEAEERWQRLKSAFDARDLAVVSREAHTLASSCGTFGLAAASALFRNLETDMLAQAEVGFAQVASIAGPFEQGLASLVSALDEAANPSS